MKKNKTERKPVKKKQLKIEKEVENIQKTLGITSSKFLSFEEIAILHNQQYSNIIKDFACKQHSGNIY